ncbi:glycosyltransferase [Ferruginibacter sp. HRS2-29]|nr:glycosyltransferase [Ferruginibacter sp. HRS2-29]
MGGQKAIALFYQYLGNIIPVSIFSTGNNERAASEEFQPVLGNSVLRYGNIFLYGKLKRMMRSQSITHLFIEHPYMGWLGLLLKRSLRVPLIVRSHNIESLRFKSIGKWWWGMLWHYERFVHRRADHNFFITDEDKLFAIEHFRLDARRCHTITYGFESSRPVADSIKQDAKRQLQIRHQLQPGEKIILFNGTLDYQPNKTALEAILKFINPLLLQQENFSYRIIICGNNLPASFNGLENYRDKNIIYAGFVDDITLYFNGADIFINPVTDGGGIKTKLVEALGAGLSCISTKSGAIGVPSGITGGKMQVTEDNDWKAFAEKTMAIDITGSTPDGFYSHFYWGAIAKKAADILQNKTV